MAYKYETQYNSPNYTPASRAQATWGQPRSIKAIAIHWWGDPNQGPTYEGVIATLCNPNRGASAHYVATGTGRRVACLVNPEDASWATNSANPWTISIECDPRCRDEDYDVVAELISQIRSAYGDIPLVPHKQFVATACPGNYNLAELDRRAKLKNGSGDWGNVTNKENFDMDRNEISQLALYMRLLAGSTVEKANANNEYDTNAISVNPDYALVLAKALYDGEWQPFAYKAGHYDEDIKNAVEKAVAEAKAQWALEHPEKPSEPSQPGNGTETPSEPETGSQTLWEWLKELLSKFKRTK